MKVLKFGGSSLATTSRIRAVAEIVREEARGKPLVMVVSAFQGVTNELLECASLAARSDPNYVAASKRLFVVIARPSMTCLENGEPLVFARRLTYSSVNYVKFFTAFNFSATVHREPSISSPVLANDYRP